MAEPAAHLDIGHAQILESSPSIRGDGGSIVIEHVEPKRHGATTARLGNRSIQQDARKPPAAQGRGDGDQVEHRGAFRRRGHPPRSHTIVRTLPTVEHKRAKNGRHGRLPRKRDSGTIASGDE